MSGRREQVARGLADAALAGGGWDEAAVAQRMAAVLGSGPWAWLRPVARVAVEGWPRPPRDAPRSLARCLERSRALDAVWTHQGLRHIAVAPIAMATTPWPVRPLDGTGDLRTWLDLDPGWLAWHADRRLMARRAEDAPLHHHDHTWVRKVDGGARLLERPKQRHKALQRRILQEVIGRIPAHPAAHGFVAGRSVHTYVAPHVGRAVVLHLDLESFFATVTAGRVFGILRSAGYPEDVAHALAGLTTTVTPLVVWRAAPRPPDHLLPAHRRLGRLRARPHLPQGSPTSPALANLCAFHLDARLAGLASSVGAAYTRYADDMAFSWPNRRRAPTDMVQREVATIVADEGFRLNRRKTNVARASQRQRLTGLVVNTGPNVPREDRDRLRATLHRCLVHGAEPGERDVLLGRIAWVAASNRAQGARLRAMHDQVAWPT